VTRKGSQDLIAIVCAFVGAAGVRRLVPPMDGVPVVFMSLAGAAVGLMLARAVFRVLNDKDAACAALKQADTTKSKNDAEFVKRPYDDGKGGQV
jgi:hypothetical protein